MVNTIENKAVVYHISFRLSVSIKTYPGIFSAVFVKKYGSRPIAITGTALASVGVFTSAFANNIETMYFTFGVITGNVNK